MKILDIYQNIRGNQPRQFFRDYGSKSDAIAQVYYMPTKEALRSVLCEVLVYESRISPGVGLSDLLFKEVVDYLGVPLSRPDRLFLDSMLPLGSDAVLTTTLS